jgi:hypothetical protein
MRTEDYPRHCHPKYCHCPACTRGWGDYFAAVRESERLIAADPEGLYVRNDFAAWVESDPEPPTEGPS